MVHWLAPDEDVRAHKWFRGDGGRPTQAERIRHIVQAGGDTTTDQVVDAADLVDEKLGKLGRSVYTRANKAFHAGTQRREVERIVNAVVVVLDDVLPPA